MIHHNQIDNSIIIWRYSFKYSLYKISVEFSSSENYADSGAKIRVYYRDTTILYLAFVIRTYFKLGNCTLTVDILNEIKRNKIGTHRW